MVPGICKIKIGSPERSQENTVSSAFYVVDSIEFFTKPRYKSKVFLHQKYVVEKLTSDEIAKLCFSSRPTISKYLKLHGIPIRRAEERLALNKGQLALGEKRYKGTVQKNWAEIKIVEQIFDLRSQGYSYRQVAAWLDAKGIKPKNKCSPWQATTVMKIAKRTQSKNQDQDKL
ncbi:MAG: recombinase family protein [Bdellovibrionaceae bacterium]|nr:recombinase family protein [Pseudobdellovibrionaceae bacterium]